MTGLRVSMTLRLRKTRRGWEGGLSRWLAEKQPGVVWLTALMAAWLIVVVGVMPGLIAERLAFIGGGNDVKVKVDSLTVPLNNGTVQSITAPGFPLKAAMFSASGGLTSGTWRADIRQSIGFATGTGATQQYAVGGASADNLATTDTSRRMASTRCISIIHSSDGSELAGAQLTAITATGFDLTWTKTVSTQWEVIYVALGGDIQAEVLNWNTGTGTGSKLVNIGTIQPDLVFHMFIDQTTLGSGTGMRLGFGAMNSAGEQWAVAVSANDAVTPSDTSRWQRTNACLIGTTTSEGQRFLASYVSMNANGFTTNFSLNDGANTQVASLCIKGVKSKLGAFNKPTSAGPVTTSITAPNFSPAVVLAASFYKAANTSPQTQAAMSLGATDGTNQRAVAQFDNDAANPTQADSVWYSTASIVIPAAGNPASTNSLGTMALTALGFDATFNPNGGDASEVVYAAIGPKD